MIDVIIKDSWVHPWEGFKSSYNGCTQNEIDWVHNAYEGENVEVGWPSPGSISWIMNHVGACKQAYAADIAQPDDPDINIVWVAKREISELVRELEEINITFWNSCRKANPNVFIKGKGGQTLAQYIGMALRHEIRHAGQNALIRRLYRKRQQ